MQLSSLLLGMECQVLACAWLVIASSLPAKGDLVTDAPLNFFEKLVATSIITIVVSGPVLATTPIYSDLQISASFRTIDGGDFSSYDRYSGFIAKAGDAVNITCSKNSRGIAELYVIEEKGQPKHPVLEEPGRVVFIDTPRQLVVAILSAQPKDSGRYYCTPDARNLTIVTTDNPPSIISHQCVNVRYNDFYCKFLTNSNWRDFVDWSVSIDIKKHVNCYNQACKDVDCKSLKWHLPKDGEPGGTLVCTLNNWIYKDAPYEMTISASNPFVNSSTIVDVNFDTAILQLGPPDILNHTTEAVQVQLSNMDQSTQNQQYASPGIFEEAVAENGIKYRVTVDSKLLRSTDANWTVPRIYTFQDTNIHTWLHIPDLLPFTLYSLDVVSQMNHTINKDVWSLSSKTYLQTKEGEPEEAPGNSRYGFAITASSTRCHAERLVTLYWKKLPEIPTKSNGKMVSYSIYNLRSLGLTSRQVLQRIRQSSYNQKVNELAQVSVDKSQSFAEVCVGSQASELMLVPQNSVNFGRKSAIYSIPAEHEEVQFPACNISAVYHETADLLRVTWSSVPAHYNITVFWCEIDVDRNCIEEDIYWRDVGSGKELKLEGWKNQTKQTVQYKFGLSAISAHRESSGIIWASCINPVEEDLLPAAISVTLQGLEAIVTINEECYLKSRMADYYTVNFCSYNNLTGECISDEDEKAERSEVETNSCNLVVKKTLRKYSAWYAFWVVSHADDLTAPSAMLVKKTDRKELTWEIAVPVILALLLVVCITLGIVYCNGQKRRVEKLMRVQLVLPPEIPIETRSASASDEEDIDAYQYPCAEYASPSHPLKPLVSSDESHKTNGLDYKNHVLGLTQPEDSNNTCDVSNLVPNTSYQPHLTHKGTKMNSGLSGSDCHKLPDDYVQCTETRQPWTEDPLSYSDSGWSTVDDSRSTSIDISKFLNSGSQISGKYLPKPQHSCPSNESVDDLTSEISEESETNNNLNSGGSQEVPTYDESEHLPEISSYCHVTQLMPETSSERVDTGVSQTELSSLDSGFVGRHLEKDPCTEKALISST